MRIATLACMLCLPATATASTIQPRLAQELAAAEPSDQVTAVVTVAGAGKRATARRLRRDGLDVIRFRRLPFLAVRGTASELRAAGRARGVRRLSANGRIDLALAQTRGAIGASAVHEQLGVTGEGVNVAVVDSGVDGEHPDLAAAMVENVSVAAEPDVWSEVGDGRPGQLPDAGMVVGPSDRDATSGHGTHVAGIVAGRGDASGGRNRGIAPGAGIVGVGAGKSASMLMALFGLEYVLENHERLRIEIVNNSWEAAPDVAPYDPEDPVNVATRALHAAGVAVVFAAGNSGPGQGTLNVFAPWPWVYSVALGCVPGKAPRYSDCVIADMSARGVPDHAMMHPDVTAPGNGVTSARALLTHAPTTWDKDLTGACGQADPVADLAWYTCISGTSQAAPHVAGTMALMEEAARCDLTPDQLFTLVSATAAPMPGRGEWEVGAGFLDARAAVDRVRADRRKLCRPRRGRIGEDRRP